VASGVPSEFAANFAVDRADARSAGEVRFGTGVVFAPRGEDDFVGRSLAVAAASGLCARATSLRVASRGRRSPAGVRCGGACVL